jgi:hypothetical protein
VGFGCVPAALGFVWFVCLRGALVLFLWRGTFVDLGSRAGLVVCLPAALAFSCFVIGLLVLPLCGAALTFFAAAKKAKQRKRLNPPAHKRVPRTVTVVVHLESVFSHIQPW